MMFLDQWSMSRLDVGMMSSSNCLVGLKAGRNEAKRFLEFVVRWGHNKEERIWVNCGPLTICRQFKGTRFRSKV